MSHTMQSHGKPAEWSDTYRCTKCGIVLTFNAEEMVSAAEAASSHLPCKIGQYFVTAPNYD